jgi:hypothetical protein
MLEPVLFPPLGSAGLQTGSGLMPLADNKIVAAKERRLL